MSCTGAVCSVGPHPHERIVEGEPGPQSRGRCGKRRRRPVSRPGAGGCRDETGRIVATVVLVASRGHAIWPYLRAGGWRWRRPIGTPRCAWCPTLPVEPDEPVALQRFGTSRRVAVRGRLAEVVDAGYQSILMALAEEPAEVVCDLTGVTGPVGRRGRRRAGLGRVRGGALAGEPGRDDLPRRGPAPRAGPAPRHPLRRAR